MRLKRFFIRSASRFQQRGSALLASLMVIVGLSLLGLGFVAMSETESAISVNERNHTQTVALAESGARLAVQWFQFPDRMLAAGLMPANDAATHTFKIERDSGPYTGYYKPNAGELLFDLPFGPRDADKFYGDEDSADISITRATTEGRDFLDSLNLQLLGPEPTGGARPAGEITEIRIFAPPLVGATLVPGPAQPAPRFWEGGTRYGVATIMVRAEKFDSPVANATRRSLARAECRIVVSQFPLPNPAGPLQSATSLATNGNFHVHWGMVSAQQALDLQKDYVSIPWFNAYEPVHFNRGYDSSVQWSPNVNYVVGDIVRPLPATVTAQPLLQYREFRVTVAGNSGAVEPAWPTVNNGTVTLNGVTYQERPSTAWPLTAGGATNASNTPWLYYVASGGLNIEDPWFHARSYQNILGSPNNNAQPYTFPFNNPGNYGSTHHFQFQSFDQYPNFKELIFPIMNYDFWKAAAIAGNGQQGVKYLESVGGMNYTDGITTKDFRAWASSQSGFYFFDTANKQNPQSGGPGILAPQISINGGGAYMAGFIYLNAPFATTGLSGPNGYFNQPGEPYMDIGYREVALVPGGGVNVGDFVRDAAGMPIIIGAVNKQWDYQDLPWSNTGAVAGGTANGVFDVNVRQRTVRNPAGGAQYTGWFVEPYRPGCLPGNSTCGACNCSEPHEPYLNIRYDGSAMGVTIGWQDPATQNRQAKRTTNGQRVGIPVTCNAGSSQDDCTSNAYDLDGGLVDLPPATDGVFYVEGEFNSKGNADYFGSVLVGEGGVNSQGTPIIWYDESLSRGNWRPPGMPRVMVTSVETDR